MNTVAKLTQKQIEKLAVRIRTFLLEHDMWDGHSDLFQRKML